MLSNTDHPLAFSPTYFSPTLQSLADSPTVEVPINPVTVLLPLQPIEVGPTVNNELVAQNDIKHCKNIETENDSVNYSIPKKSSASTTEYLGPYRSNPNFTQGKKLSIEAAKSSTLKVKIQTSFLNDKIVVARKKVTKRVDRSERRGDKLKPKKVGKPKGEKPKGPTKLATKVAQKSTPADGGVKKPHCYH